MQLLNQYGSLLFTWSIDTQTVAAKRGDLAAGLVDDRGRKILSLCDIFDKLFSHFLEMGKNLLSLLRGLCTLEVVLGLELSDELLIKMEIRLSREVGRDGWCQSPFLRSLGVRHDGFGKGKGGSGGCSS